jgi:Ca2+/Na+ antiporter
MFYLIVAEGTLIDWWIVSRETAFFLLYLAVMSGLLYGNKVELFGALILICLYILHIFLMKYSSKYEIAIKKILAQTMEIKELKRMANNQEIYRFHQTLKSESICIE